MCLSSHVALLLPEVELLGVYCKYLTPIKQEAFCPGCTCEDNEICPPE